MDDIQWQGWVSSPDQRGTIEILWTCLTTIYLCLVTMLHLNVPGPRDRFKNLFWRKARWAFLGLLAPELPMLFACGQWTSAHRSVQAMHDLGYGEWSLEHGFYADMGGFVLRPPDAEPFPISAKILHYLVRNNMVPLPSITQREIHDKSKADIITKCLTFFQALWVLAQIIGRAGEGLPITPLELSTMCIAGCSFTTLWFWRKKPLDVLIPTIIDMDCPIAVLAAGAGENSNGVIEKTPLDFIEPEAYISRKWSQRVLRWIEVLELQTTPMDRIPNDRDPQPSSLTAHICLGIVTAAFASIHFEAWHTEFPTEWEQTFWRINCCAMWLLLAVYGTFEVIVCWREDFQILGLDTLNGYKRRFPDCLWFFIPAGLYLLTRVNILFESIWSLRYMPSNAFDTISWAEIFPHI